MSKAIIGATSALCAIGGGSEQVWASHRAGIGKIGNSHVMDRHFDAIQMGLVPEEQLPPLAPDLEAAGLPARARRMLRLAAPTFASIAQSLKAPVRVFLGLPELDAGKSPWLADFLAHLSKAANIPLDMEHSGVIPRGRAAALRAIEAALDALAADPATPVVVGGVDTYLDLRLLVDGFKPGEGAAFLVLHAPTQTPQIRTASLDGAASFKDEGHRFGKAPAKGEGLANAIEKLRGSLQQPSAPVSTTFAGFNGENFDAKLWGVAQLRHTDFFAPTMQMEHPADKFGDAGAACGVLLTVMAATALAKGQRPGPALVWAASDSDLRACALLSAFP
jgi:3-oxoacyl-[acyl-carrier-protein] synthase-1